MTRGHIYVIEKSPCPWNVFIQSLCHTRNILSLATRDMCYPNDKNKWSLLSTLELLLSAGTFHREHVVRVESYIFIMDNCVSCKNRCQPTNMVAWYAANIRKKVHVTCFVAGIFFTLSRRWVGRPGMLKSTRTRCMTGIQCSICSFISRATLGNPVCPE